MDEERKKLLWKKILETGDYLKDKLPDHLSHPKGRNPYAHVALEIKNKFNHSYKDIPNNQFEDVIIFLEYLKKNPS